MPIKTDSSNRIPNAHLIDTNTGGQISLHLHTAEDERLTLQPQDQLAHISLNDIRQAKASLVLDAADGKLDFQAAGFSLERPSHRMFWSNNSAAALMVRLAEGHRELVINGKKVEIPQSFKNWVRSTQNLEGLRGAPLGDS